jgi:hypothetical protein
MFCIPPGGVSPSRHTACAFVVGKNYRLQDIQLSKKRLGGWSGALPLDQPSNLTSQARCRASWAETTHARLRRIGQAGLPAVARSATPRPAFAKASAGSLRLHS